MHVFLLRERMPFHSKIRRIYTLQPCRSQIARSRCLKAGADLTSLPGLAAEFAAVFTIEPLDFASSAPEDNDPALCARLLVNIGF